MKHITVDARADVCPVPVVKAKNAVRDLGGAGTVEVLAGNEISAQNLHKFGAQKGYGVRTEQTGDSEWRITFTISEEAAGAVDAGADQDASDVEACGCAPGQPGPLRGTVAAIGSACMGTGDDRLGKNLMKAFIFALGQQDVLPDTLLFYNGGASLTCEGSDSIEDLRQMEAAGVTILTCGTCLDFYGLRDKLQVGGITNMYDIVRIQTEAARILRP